VSNPLRLGSAPLVSRAAEYTELRRSRHPELDTEACLTIASHRGPVQFAAEGGQLRVRHNGGGLATSLRALTGLTGAMRWICAADTPQDHLVARAMSWNTAPLGEGECELRMLDLDAAAHNGCYAVIANPLLWFLQHGLYDACRPPRFAEVERRAWRDGYVAVNRAFAKALTDRDDIPVGSTVMVHDYHLYLTPGMVRVARPDVLIHFFGHIPWPDPATWSLLPRDVRDAIFRGLLGSDIVAFQTARDRENFLSGCTELLGLQVDSSRGTVDPEDGREVAVRNYPISVDPASLRQVAASAVVADRARTLEPLRGTRVILRVDRADPAKNITRGFEAYARLLVAHPELHERVSFLALIQPTREAVPEYADYMRAIHRVVDDVNARFGTNTWKPIVLRLEEDPALAIAAYKSFDVLFVNSIADGMNLVAKEGLVVNETSGVLALSRHTGAFAEVGGVAVPLDPLNVEQQARALFRALSMPRDERQRRLSRGRAVVGEQDLTRWFQRQLADLDAVRARRACLRTKAQRRFVA